MPSSSRRSSRRSPALATFGALVCTLLAAPSPLHAAPPPRRAPPLAPRVAPSAAWTASVTGAWRLPTPGEQVAFLDARHLVVLPYTSDLANRPMLVSLDSGAVAPLAPVLPDNASIANLARVGNRLLAFGAEDHAPAAWQLALQASPGGPTLVATALDPPAGPSGPPADYPGVIVSPDDRWIIWCPIDRPPTLRDAATLRIARTLTVPSCKRPAFPSLERVRLGDDEVELGSGEAHPAAGELRQLVGPRRRALEVQGDYRQLAVVREGKRITQQAFEFDDDVRWTSDGVAISLTRTALSLRPAADGTPRTMRPRLRYSFRRTFAVSSSHAAILDGPVLELVDLTTGESKAAEGNLAATNALVPFDGGVASAAERLRLWRAGQLAAEEDADVSILRATTSRLVAIDGWQQVWLWDPASNLRRALGQVDAIIDAFLTTAGEDVWFGTQYTLEHSSGGQPARTQARFRIGLAPLAFHPRGLFALGEEPDLLHLAEFGSGRARRWRLAKHCSFVPDGLLPDRMVLRGLSDLHVIDLESGSDVSFEFSTSRTPDVAVSTIGDLALANEDMLMLWRPGEDQVRRHVLALPQGALVTTVRFSLDGQSLAIGLSNGGILYFLVAGLRSHGQVFPAESSSRSCLDGSAQPESFAQLGLVVDGGAAPAKAQPKAPAKAQPKGQPKAQIVQ